jgi:protein involved in polysaccharide export with SLBB domain
MISLPPFVCPVENLVNRRVPELPFGSYWGGAPVLKYLPLLFLGSFCFAQFPPTDRAVTALEQTGLYQENAQGSLAAEEVTKPDSHGISVLGEVNKPGVYPVLSTRKLFDMISAAGGTTPKAGCDILITHRNQPDNVQKITLSSEPANQTEANVDVFPGDTIVVTKAPMVYVLGDVRFPGGFLIDKSNGLTVLRALALAQGATSTAALNSSRLIHKTSEGLKETPIYLKKILEGKAQDVKLEPDDVLFVPHSAGKARMLEQPADPPLIPPAHPVPSSPSRTQFTPSFNTQSPGQMFVGERASGGYRRVNCTSGKEEDQRICENMEFSAYVPESCYH